MRLYLFLTLIVYILMTCLLTMNCLRLTLLPFQFSQQVKASRSSNSYLPRVMKMKTNEDNEPIIESPPFNPYLKKEPLEPTLKDAQTLLDLLLRLLEPLQKSNVPVALAIVGEQMGWLYNRRLPQLMKMAIEDFQLEESNSKLPIHQAYTFVLDYLEVTAKEVELMVQGNQLLLRKLFEAAKISEKTLNQFMEREKEKLVSPEFLVFLEAEMESCPTNSPAEKTILTIKLKILDEIGKTKSNDVQAIARISSETSIERIQIKVSNALVY